MAKIKEQKSAEEMLQAEAERKQREKEEQLLLEEEKKKREEEQHLIMIEEEKKLQKENKRLKEMEEGQKSRESKLLSDDSKHRQELQNSQQNKQHKAVSVSSQQKQPKVKFDEEARLYEQLKVLQALRQQESEQNQKVSKDTSVSVDNRVTGGETSRQKHKEKMTVTKESERKLHEQKRSERETKKQKQSVKMQEDQTLDREKYVNLQAHENSDGLQKHAMTTEAPESEELSRRKEEEKAKQEQKANEVNESCSIVKSKDTSSESFTRNKQLVTEKCISQVQVTSACAEHEMKLRSSTDIAKKNVKCENNQSELWKDVNGHSGSTVASQVQKLTTAKCQDKDSTGNEFSNVWEKTVEAKRLKWMHECESWRYVQPLATFCYTFSIIIIAVFSL